MLHEPIADLILRLKQEGISITLHGDDLKVSFPKGNVSKQVLTELKDRKADIMLFLKNTNPGNQGEIHAIDRQTNYEISPSQQRIWLFEQINDSKQIYNVPGAYQLAGKLDSGILERALNALISRHEILRTSFHNVDGTIRQVVHDELLYPLQESDLTAVGRQGRAESYIENNLEIRFDLKKLPLFSFKLVRLREEMTLVLFNLHHIICDGQSLQRLYQELFSLYRFYSGDNTAGLDPLRIQYKDYAFWFNRLLESQQFNKHKQYWHKKLAKIEEPQQLPYDYPYPSRLSYRGKTQSFSILADDTARLKNLAMSENCSLFNGLLAFVNILLYRLGGISDICIGTPVVGRQRADLENQIGCYINLVILRNCILGTSSCRTLLKTIQKNTVDAYSHMLYPFDRLVSELPIARNSNHNPLFNVMVTLQEDQSEQLLTKGFEVIPHPIRSKIGRYELTFGFEETRGAIALNIEYMSDLFSEDTVEKLGVCFLELLHSGLDRPECAVDDLNLLSRFDREQIDRFNDTGREQYPVESLLPLLEQQYQSAPNRTACVYHDQSVSGQTLHTIANRIASTLIHKFKVQPEEIVGTLVGRNTRMIATLLGIMKSGAAYLPIQPDYPKGRIRHIIDNSRCRLIITEKEFQDHLDDLPVIVISLDDLERSETDFQPTPVSANHLAYVLYTSGSTGQPKGVMIEHGSLINTLLWFTDTYRIGKESRVLLMSEYSFDVSLEEIFGTLLVGATLYIPPKESLFNRHKFRSYITRHQITIAQFVPGTLQQLLADGEKIPSLNTVICGGEILPEDLKNKILAAGYKLYNHYGPTECTVDALVSECHADDPVVIGKPIVNMNAHILDGRKQKLPLNMPGELHLSGLGVARGYLNDPYLTAEKFIVDSANPEHRLYATGDLARWRPDGTIEFLGRLDGQIKLRGFRIEPEEIIRVLGRHPAVKQSIVIDRCRDSGKKTLFAYLVPITSDAAVPDAQVREFLEDYLPLYMIPSHYFWIDSIPLNDHGKCNYDELPEVIPNNGITKSASPLTDNQTALIDVLGSVIGNQNIDINDNYFELGGDSIQAIQVISRLYERGLSLEIGDIFNYPTIIGLSTRLKKSDRQASQEVVSGIVPLSPIQSWYLKNFNYGGRRYNQATVLFSEARFQEKHIRTALATLIAHHDQLRASFCIDPSTSKLVQHVPFSISTFDIPVHDLTQSENPIKAINDHGAELQASISIEQPPLLRTDIFRCNKGDYLSVIIHHLVVDGLSWRIILEDLFTAYNQSIRGERISLPPKSHSFRDWVEYIHTFGRSRELLDEEAYWHGLVNARCDRLPPDLRGAGSSYAQGHRLTRRLTSLQTAALLNIRQNTHRTDIDAVLLSGLALALRLVWDFSRTVIMLESHGRDRFGDSPNVSRTVGWFTCRYPFVLNNDGKTIRQRIDIVHKALLSVPQNGIGHGILEFLTPSQLRCFSEITPEAQIEFNYLGQVDSQDSGFRFAQIPLGRGIDPAATRPIDLEINCVVIEGQLEIEIAYNKHQFFEKTVRHFLDMYVTELTRISNDEECHKDAPIDVMTGALTAEEYERLAEEHRSWRDKVCSITKLSPIQQGMLFDTIRRPEISLYYDQMTMLLTGNIFPEIFQRAWSFLVDRHETLRARFIHVGVARPVQVTLAHSEIDGFFEFRDLAGLDPDQQQFQFQRAIQQDEQRSFNLSDDTPIRVCLFRLNTTQYRLMISNHHIILDGWSASALFREFIYVYHCLAAPREITLPPLGSYAAYLDWIDGNTGKEQQEYWRTYLKDYGRPTGLPFKTSNPGGAFARVQSHINSSLTAQLIRLSREKKVTLFALIQAIWGILLGKYNETDDVVFGVVVSIRPPEIDGIEHSLGLYVNTIPVRIRDFDDLTFEELICHIQKETLLSWQHQHFPLYEIQKSTALRDNLFDHLLIFENYPNGKQARSDQPEHDFEISEIGISERANYGIVVEVTPGTRLQFTLGYDSSVYKQADMDQILGHIKTLTLAIFEGSGKQKIKELSLLGAESASELSYRVREEQRFFSELGEMNFE